MDGIDILIMTRWRRCGGASNMIAARGGKSSSINHCDSNLQHSDQGLVNWDVKAAVVWKGIRFCGTLELQDVDRLSIVESYPGHSAALALTAPQLKPQPFLTQNSEARKDKDSSTSTVVRRRRRRRRRQLCYYYYYSSSSSPSVRPLMCPVHSRILKFQWRDK